jgi:hypothetical protein
MPRLPAASLSSLVLLLFSAVAAPSARAADAPSEKDFQAIISAQIDAFGRGDAPAAHRFASPGIQGKFPDPAQFLAMVRQSYPPLIHPKSTHFDGVGATALGPMETVTIVDSSGVVWTAIYTFELVDGEWRITGCSLVKAPDVGA